VFEPLRAGVSHVGQPLREHRLGFPRKGAHRSVELASEALRGILTWGLHELREPLCGLLGVWCHRTVDSALELLDLAVGHVREAGSYALHRVDLLALRLLGQLALPAGHPLLELMESPSALRCVRVELAAHETEGIVDRAGELGAQPRNSGALLVTLGRQPLGVGGEA
jgi:hypothetical protein